MSVVAPKQSMIVVGAIESNVKGEWAMVPALNVNGINVTVTNELLRIAHVHDEEWLDGEIQDPELCVQALKSDVPDALRADIFTFAQKLPSTLPKYSYPMERESIAAIRVTSFNHWWEALPQVTRKNVRRAQKRGVDVSVRKLDDSLIRDIVELTKDSPIRQGKRFVHFGKTFDQTKKDQSTHLDRSDFICAYSGSELIGLAKIVYGGSVASILQFLPKASQQDKRPANALIAKMVEVCEANRISHLVYGQFNYGNKRNSSLLEFKIRNGFEEIFVPRFYVPLNAKGVLGLKLNLHQGLVGMLPNSLINAGLNLREKWYELRGVPGRCSSMAEQPNRIRQTERSIPPAGSNQEAD